LEQAVGKRGLARAGAANEHDQREFGKLEGILGHNQLVQGSVANHKIRHQPALSNFSMKVGKQFNTLTYGEYLHLIEHHQKFSDFNTLGLFRSIVETTKLSLEQKLELRKIAVAAFSKTFDFLQLKDPVTYFEVRFLGESLTIADRHQAWKDIRHSQQEILKSKKLNHRNFGTYARHCCGIDTCPIKGVMLKQTGRSANSMHFRTDKNSYATQQKAEVRKKDRKIKKRLISQLLSSEQS
jgi:hypothetical protein